MIVGNYFRRIKALANVHAFEKSFAKRVKNQKCRLTLFSILRGQLSPFQGPIILSFCIIDVVLSELYSRLENVKQLILGGGQIKSLECFRQNNLISRSIYANCLSHWSEHKKWCAECRSVRAAPPTHWGAQKQRREEQRGGGGVGVL